MKLFALIFVVVLACGSTAQAKCGSGSPPSYDDIEAVMFQQNGGTCKPGSVPTGTYLPNHFPVIGFDCSTFWALFWNVERPGGDYSQYNLPFQRGTYWLQTTLENIRRILKRDHFFEIAPPDNHSAHTSRAILSVKRCGVISRIVRYDTKAPYDPLSRTLFEDIRDAIRTSAKTLTGSRPTDFQFTTLFDPN